MGSERSTRGNHWRECRPLVLLWRPGGLEESCNMSMCYPTLWRLFLVASVSKALLATRFVVTPRPLWPLRLPLPLAVLSLASLLQATIALRMIASARVCARFSACVRACNLKNAPPKRIIHPRTSLLVKNRLTHIHIYTHTYTHSTCELRFNKRHLNPGP